MPASIWSTCIWSASLTKQNREIHWHFESWIHRRCCLQCTENIRSQQPEQARCQAISLPEKEDWASRPPRIRSGSAAAVWVWLCTSCSRRPTLTLNPWGTSELSFKQKTLPGQPRAKAKTMWRLKEGGVLEDWLWGNSWEESGGRIVALQGLFRLLKFAHGVGV